MWAALALGLGLRRGGPVFVRDAKLATEFRELDLQLLLRQSAKSGGSGETVLAFDSGSGRHADTQQQDKDHRGDPSLSHASDES